MMRFLLGGALDCFVFQKLERLLHLKIFSGWLGSWSGCDILLFISLLRFRDRVIVVAGQIVRIDCVSYFLTLHFDIRSNTGMRTIFAEECLAIRARPFHSRQQQSVAAA